VRGGDPHPPARAEEKRPADASRLVLAPDAATLARDLAAHRKRLAFLRADVVGPSVRALGWGNKALFGVGGVKALSEWGLTARLPDASGAGFDPAVTPMGSGLQNMADRLAALGGSVDVRSKPGFGTTIVGRVPTAG